MHLLRSFVVSLSFGALVLGSPAPVKSSKKSSTTTATSAKSTATTKTSTTTPTSVKTTTTPTSTPSTKTSATSTTTQPADGSCTNGPLTRDCWSGGYSIAADFDEKWPTTGVTRSYTLEFTNGTLSPDGVSRPGLLINGEYPGPTIYADWGDYISVTVKNSMQDNGTGIHWHGIRQYQTNLMDGVPGVTECPLAPGSSKTYSWHATQYGTTWYHTHFSTQYGDGILGSLVINGPATANYDVDLGPMPVTDWYYTPVSALAAYIGHSGAPPPTADNGLINSTMVSASGSGKYYVTSITKGKKYRIRLINVSVDNHFAVSLDDHVLEVITSDFVPIVPFYTNWLFIGIGQRYDVIINANQTADNYWFRAEVQSGCGENANNGNILSIFRYAGASTSNPTSTAVGYTQGCTDPQGLTPYWDSFVPKGPLTEGNLNVEIDIGVATDGSQVVQWGVNFSALSVEWNKPIIQYVLDGNSSYPSTENLISLPTGGQWYYWVIQEVAGNIGPINVPHPIHLHGHDFYVLATGVGTYSTSDALNYNNPTRRDVAMLPAGGWLVLAFQTDNPGAWLMHCHIAWHAGEGLAVQFLENISQMEGVDPAAGSDFESVCSSWNTYYPAHAAYLRDSDDSGI